MAQRGRCPACGALFVVRQDGMLRHHTDATQPLTSNLWAPVCRGAGKPPVPSSDTEGGEGR